MIYCKESDELSEEGWQAKLEISPQELNKLIKYGVLKASKLKEDTLFLKLEFVGEIVANNSYIASLPKCLKGDSENFETVKLVSEVLSHYFDFRKKQKAVFESSYAELVFEDKLEIHETQEIEVYLSLQAYFERRGVYKRSEFASVKSNNQKIDWKKTVQKNDVYLDGWSAFYPEPYTKNSFQIENVISNVFKSVMCHLTTKYANKDTESLIHSECQTYLSFEQLIDQSQIYCTHVKLELLQTFNSEDILMLQIIHDYIEKGKSFRFRGLNEVKLYGTNNFQIIWEYICSGIFNNQYNNLIDDFAQPRWLINNHLLKERGRFTPDVLLSVDDNLIILDAKYYYPIPKNICGVSDIAKQLLYSQIAKSDNVKNIFLFPGDDSSVSMEYLGYVSIYDDTGKELEIFAPQRIAVVRLALVGAIKALLSKDQRYIDEVVIEVGLRA